MSIFWARILTIFNLLYSRQDIILCVLLVSCPNNLPVRAESLDHARGWWGVVVRLGESLQFLHELGQIRGVLGLHSDPDDRGDGELHHLHVVRFLEGGQGSSLHQELINTDQSADVSGGNILDGLVSLITPPGLQRRQTFNINKLTSGGEGGTLTMFHVLTSVVSVQARQDVLGETFQLETLGHSEQPLELLLPDLHLPAVHEVQQHPGLGQGNVLGEEITINGMAVCCKFSKEILIFPQ